jgi:hypothetical protein
MTAMDGGTMEPDDAAASPSDTLPNATAFDIAFEPRHQHSNACWWDLTQASWVCAQQGSADDRTAAG